MSDKISKNEFKENLLENLDSLYDSYLKAFEASNEGDSPLDRLKRTRNIKSDFKASPPVFSEEQIEKDLRELKKAVTAEQNAIRIGKVVLMIATKGYV